MNYEKVSSSAEASCKVYSIMRSPSLKNLKLFVSAATIVQEKGDVGFCFFFITTQSLLHRPNMILLTINGNIPMDKNQEQIEVSPHLPLENIGNRCSEDSHLSSLISEFKCPLISLYCTAPHGSMLNVRENDPAGTFCISHLKVM